ncbi:V-type ATP synthase subunit B, partial [bacterium]|nr:V-type ATP synthase subunit B [bacterium]
MAVTDRGLEYVGLDQINGPLIYVDAVRDVGFGEVVEITDAQGAHRLGTVLEVSDRRAVVQVLEGTSGLGGHSTRVRFLGKPLTLAVSRDMLGRVFDGLGRPIDGGPPPLSGDERDINGDPINPFSRHYPRDFIQTGISAIDGMNTLVRGQKLPIFSSNGLPHDR